jgi:beta-lactam-binding protein with PASTA domain/predicted Ser/Thr protein kinase
VDAFSLIGQLFDGRYMIERQIGSGGMADVYLATDQSLGRKVAIKILSDRYARDAAFVERFRREAAAAAGLRHPNIVTVYDRGEAMGTSYIAMEYLDGPTLKEEITRRAPLPEPEAINYATQALAALEAAHRQGVVHRDVKPHNMVLTDEGRLKVTDFGIARAANTQQMTEVGSIVGTAQYLSPEQARGLAVGPESDIYSMGVVLYEMLCGDLPFTGESAVDIAMKQVSDTPPPLNRRNRLVSPAMEQVVMRALAKDPALRFSSAKAMAEELARVDRGQSASADTQQATRVIAAGDATRVIGREPEGATSVMRPAAPPQPPPERPAPRRSAWPWVLVLVLLALAAVAGFVVYTMLSGNDKTVPDTVIGQSCTQAKATLRAEGLKGRCENTQSSLPEIKKVVRTDPSVGSGVSSGSTVVLLVGVGPKAITVPHVKGLSATDAHNLLVSKGFTVNPTNANVNTPAAALGIVVGSTPKEGTSQKLGVEVTLRVATGNVQIADVKGKSCADATQALQKLTLKPTCRNQASQQADRGDAFATYPYAIGTTAPQHSSITILISTGPSQEQLPNVVGQDSGDAKRALRAAGFKVTVTQKVECNDQTQDNIVQAQNPNGPTAPRGSVVNITVAKFRPNDPSCGGPPPST